MAGRVGIADPANWAAVREGMRLVVHGARGTARALLPIEGYEIAGKSGTAQVVQQAHGEAYDASETAEHLRHHALFIAYAPADRPTIAVAAVVEHGGGGSREAAPVAKAVIEAWLGQGPVQ